MAPKLAAVRATWRIGPTFGGWSGQRGDEFTNLSFPCWILLKFFLQQLTIFWCLQHARDQADTLKPVTGLGSPSWLINVNCWHWILTEICLCMYIYIYICKHIHTCIICLCMLIISYICPKALIQQRSQAEGNNRVGLCCVYTHPDSLQTTI